MSVFRKYAVSVLLLLRRPPPLSLYNSYPSLPVWIAPPLSTAEFEIQQALILDRLGLRCDASCSVVAVPLDAFPRPPVRYLAFTHVIHVLAVLGFLVALHVFV